MTSNKLFNTLKRIYAKDGYIFLSINLFCFIIIFFILNENTGGGIGFRMLTFFLCTLIGGLFGAYWGIKRKGDVIFWVRGGAGFLLLFTTLIAWSNNKYGGVSINCSGDNEVYNDGYTHGKIISHASDAMSTSCGDYISQMKNQGVVLNENDCFCQGYYDGRAGRMNKYK